MNFNIYLYLLYIIYPIVIHGLQGRYPIAIFHGIYEKCTNEINQQVVRIFGDTLNVYTRCIEIGNEEITSMFKSMNEQGQIGCEQINLDMNFHGDFALVGISQGALIARYILQKCETVGKVKKYLSFGGPHMGIARPPRCFNGPICELARIFIDQLTTNKIIQSKVAPASYWRDPLKPNYFLKFSLFLADLNNELINKNPIYIQRFHSLEKLVLVKFIQEQVVFPSATSWFEYIDSFNQTVNFTSTDVFKYNYLGLQELYYSNKINFLSLPGKHVQWTPQDLVNISNELA